MNDKRQVKHHLNQPDLGIDFLSGFKKTPDGYISSCPSCPWTSGVKEFWGSSQISYYKHLDYIINNTRKD